MMPAGIRGQYVGAWATSRFRILLEGPVCRAWFLSERFMRQTVGLADLIIPMVPPESMRSPDSLSIDDITQFMWGLDADCFRVEGDYAAFIQTHLMPPLTDARGGEEALRLTRATRARASWARQRTGWPKLPTTLTCWRHTGDAYQVVIELAATGYELVGVQGPTQAPIEYTGRALELIASLIDMVQRREMLLGLYGITIPAISSAPAAAAAVPAPAPAVPPSAAGRRGRDRSARAQSSPPGPILHDDDTENE